MRTVGWNCLCYHRLSIVFPSQSLSLISAPKINSEKWNAAKEEHEAITVETVNSCPSRSMEPKVIKRSKLNGTVNALPLRNHINWIYLKMGRAQLNMMLNASFGNVSSVRHNLEANNNLVFRRNLRNIPFIDTKKSRLSLIQRKSHFLIFYWFLEQILLTFELISFWSSSSFPMFFAFIAFGQLLNLFFFLFPNEKLNVTGERFLPVSGKLSYLLRQGVR